MLRFEQWTPPAVQDGAPLILLLHGRGSHMGDLMGLQPYLPQEAIVVAPQAPFPSAPWGYGPGWAWYQSAGVGRPEPESFGQSLEELQSFVSEIPQRLPVRHGALVMGGFSQGGVMSMAYTLGNPGQVGHCLNLSGLLPDHPAVTATPEKVRGVRFFWGHGTQDPIVPFAMAGKDRTLLQQAGADLTARDYPLGHEINLAELQDVLAWLREGIKDSKA